MDLSGLAGAASGLAGGALAGGISRSGAGASEEDFRREVAENFALIEERLQLLEDQLQELREMLGGEVDPGGDLTEPDLTEPEGGLNPEDGPEPTNSL